MGHYVLAFAADRKEKTIGYLDPAVHSGPVWVSEAVFDAARKSEGTDEDIIICISGTTCRQIDSINKI